ncbi:Clavaminate synthase-like protein [Hesseltinella vesiculosa]|uniref:Clavaminate synthase-like protein n=1 Tax=Hesseltinella vesiculosa TaxID=101127 RepID=A0A1X2G522_9FUNG|nr:Clavaminate synthase-like protein [Hesseltinella vesiculosa]
MVSSLLDSKKRKHAHGKKYKESRTNRYERKINRAKSRVREELDLFAWNKWKYAEQDFWIDPYVDTVHRIDYRKVSKQEFIDQYEAPNVPVVITHCTDEWPAAKCWNEQAFLERYSKDMFKVGEDDDGNNVYMKMKYFLDYCQHGAKKDDSPMYIFDSGFYRDRKKNRASSKKRNDTASTSASEQDDHVDRSKRSKKQPCSSYTTLSLLKDYQVPDYFTDDLFRWTGEQRRPPYRWLVCGEERSGTGIHTDPLGTSAWNALVKGHKRWALFPPGTPNDIIDPPMKPHDHEGVSWFAEVFPKLQARTDPSDPRTLGEKLGMVQVLQRPGETIFVPGGWAHVVMNLDMTIAITQNFCSPTNVEYVYLNTRHSRPKLGAKFYRQMKKLASKYPASDFAKIATKLDTLHFVPQIPPSSSSSSSSSSTSSSSSSSTSLSDLEALGPNAVSSTGSETDLSDGTCMCKKCKRKRKKLERQKLEHPSPSKS